MLADQEIADSFSENFAAQKLAQTAKKTICALEGLGPIRVNAVLVKRELLFLWRRSWTLSCRLAASLTFPSFVFLEIPSSCGVLQRLASNLCDKNKRRKKAGECNLSVRHPQSALYWHRHHI